MDWIFVSFPSAISWFTADFMLGHLYSHYAIQYWDAFVRLSFFLIVSHLLTKLKISFMNEQMLSRTDLVTGLPNIREFYELAYQEIERARRFRRPFTIGYIDLDNFMVPKAGFEPARPIDH
jgi:predicted signal transduction protein with EAL and GGDEF domain